MYVKKKNTLEKRLVVQFQDLNAITVKDPWPLPSITDLLETYEGASLFSTMDLLRGFNQIAVDEETIPKLTMATPWGCFSYKVMPFGIVNGPATFSRAIYLAMQGFLNEFVSTYIDDITVFSASFEDHLSHLEKVLQRFQEVSMILKSNKCLFARSEVEVLGFLVSKFGIKPHPQNVEKILKFPTPKSKTDIRAFVSLAGFYGRHVQSFGELVVSLNKLLKKNEPFVWTQEQEQAFKTLKECIINAVQLKYSDPSKPYKLYTDASDIGVGAVLAQLDEELNEDRPICFLSRKLLPNEMNYPIVEKELLAVIYALKKLRKYLLDKIFTLYTDNTAVRFLFFKRDPGSRLQRWVLAVQEYSFKVVHLPGKSNVVADVMSRYPPQENNESDLNDPLNELHPAWLIEQESTPYEESLMEIYLYLTNPEDQANVSRKIKIASRKYTISEKNELLRRVGQRQVKVPKISERQSVMKEVHDGHGHFGQDATWARLYSNYWWPLAYKEVKEYVKSCEPCQLYVYVPKKVQALGSVLINSLFERFAVDYVGPFPTSYKGNKYIIVVVEYFTKWPIAKAVESADRIHSGIGNPRLSKKSHDESYILLGPHYGGYPWQPDVETEKWF
ncbi:hypothetical protein G6F23_010807 [Rhizopus arrhizus]|nr:hypothetical protein G6F23_010807 [Rhizopus arrhizus]